MLGRKVDPDNQALRTLLILSPSGGVLVQWYKCNILNCMLVIDTVWGQVEQVHTVIWPSRECRTGMGSPVSVSSWHWNNDWRKLSGSFVWPGGVCCWWCSWNQVSLCSLSWPWTHFNPPASDSQIQRLWMCATAPSWEEFCFILFLTRRMASEIFLRQENSEHGIRTAKAPGWTHGRWGQRAEMTRSSHGFGPDSEDSRGELQSSDRCMTCDLGFKVIF